MRLRRFCLLSVCLVSSFLIAFFGVSIDASAESDLIITKQNAFTTQSFYGDSLDFTYNISGVPYSGTLQFKGSITDFNNGNFGEVPCRWLGCNCDPDSFISSSYTDYDVIFYSAVVPRSASLTDVTIFGTDTYFSDYARGAFLGLAFGVNNSVTSDWNSISIYPDNYCSDFRAVCANYNMSPDFSNYYGFSVVDWNRSGYAVQFRTIPYEITAGGSLGSVHFDSLKADSYGSFIFGIVCPYVGGDMQNTPPVTTTFTTSSPSSTTEINVSVDVDMTETNGILGGIRDILANLGNFIVTGITNLFIPSQEDLDAFKNTVEQLLRETFGGIPELEDQLEDAVSGLFNVTAKTSIHFDGIQFDGHYYVPEQDVSLKPAGYDDLYSFVEMIINILATIATVNTCINLVKRVVVGEVIVDVD